MINDNLILHNSYEDFKEGSFRNTEFSEYNSGITLLLNDICYENTGTYISKIINTPEFEYGVLSWNALTPYNTKIQLYGKVLVDNVWSSWLSWGTWTTTGDRYSLAPHESCDNIASVSTDTLMVKGDNKVATAFQYKIHLISEDTESSPVIKLVSFSIRNILPNKAIIKVYDNEVGAKNLDANNKILSVYNYSQMTKDPKIAGVMCSATSSSMVLKYHGVDIAPEEVAWNVYDSVYEGFGNWPFNTAFISTFGLTAYIDYFNSVDDLKREILNGNPVIVSVRYKHPNCDKDLPIITNAPCNYTFGHIIVVKGFTREDGKDYIVVNDPAARDESGVSLKYDIDEFLNAWGSKIAYVVHNDHKFSSLVKRIPVNMKPTGNTKMIDYKMYNEYNIFHNNKFIDVSNKNALTIMYKTSSADIFNKYIEPTENSSILIPSVDFSKGIFNFRFICKNSKIYFCNCEF